MTRFELQKELKKIDRCIEVLHKLITKPLCECINHLGSFDEKFREENRVQLQELITVKNKLIPLNNKPDYALEKIQYQSLRLIY
ncbi:MAG: hypothetical protein DRG09_04160 [Epsilonproteobacteria bacterium]|nr:MAG: hypothetical protein DRG09_04160 [Campylobacterota bacterium]